MKDLFACNRLLRKYIKKGQWQQSISLLQRMQEEEISPDVITINSTLSACERSAEWQRVLHFFAKQRPVMDKFTLSITLKACRRGMRWIDALELLHLAGTGEQALETMDLVVWNAAMAACERAADQAWRWCLHLLQSCPFPPDIVSFNTSLSALARARRWRQCLQMLLQIPQPDILSYNSCITACSGAAWPFALQLLSDAVEADLKLSTISFNAAIAACDKGHQWQKALQLFWELNRSHCRASEVTYSSVLSACEVSLPWRSLLQLAAGGFSWSALAVACGKQAAWCMALSLLEVMGDASTPAVSQATVRACAAALKWQAAWQLLHASRWQQTLEVTQLTHQAALGAGGMPWGQRDPHGPLDRYLGRRLREEYLEIHRLSSLGPAIEMETEEIPTLEVARLVLTSLHLRS
ncbi:unnamed protein product [Cladocopium goreaui]|uniref:Pentatricopeptide repeat-containing protein, chloroplastic n=1 Tax=Cladocopium goreaui TaxID=2562237 RepID=A0A9P1DB96_9DINO|nr:unnamed protein product [Cladocopium goreaui]